MKSATKNRELPCQLESAYIQCLTHRLAVQKNWVYPWVLDSWNENTIGNAIKKIVFALRTCELPCQLESTHVQYLTQLVLLRAPIFPGRVHWTVRRCLCLVVPIYCWLRLVGQQNGVIRTGILFFSLSISWNKFGNCESVHLVLCNFRTPVPPY